MNTNRNLWPLGIIGAFVLFFIGMTTVVVIASTHREHLVRADYYEQELKFQNQIDGGARAKQAGASVELDAVAKKIRVSVPAAQLTQKLSGTIEFYRPSAPELDRAVALAPAADGTQSLDVSQLAAGLWQVRVKWSAAGEGYFLEQKFKI
ncbi:MAG TPA: FixH family protein [Verrucomicrobiae bacterium]